MTTSVSFHPAVVANIPQLSGSDIDIAALFGQAHDHGAGAVVLFSGEVREGFSGKEVAYLDYEAHESMASKMILEIMDAAARRWDLKKIVAQHRTGKVQLGACAVVVITSSKHRKEAYAANRYVIDRIKHEVPIWKCEYFEDGSREWGGNCSCQKITGDANKHVYEFGEE